MINKAILSLRRVTQILCIILATCSILSCTNHPEKTIKNTFYLDCEDPLVKAKIMSLGQQKPEYFGYYANSIDNNKVSDHNNAYWVHSVEGIEKVAKLGHYAVWVIFIDFFNNSGHLRVDYESYWRQQWSQIKAKNLENNIAMIYTMDEPAVWAGRNKYQISPAEVTAELSKLHNFIKNEGVKNPLGIVFTATEVSLIGGPFPENTDWLGYDCYGPHENCSTIVYMEEAPSQEQITCTLLSRMNPSQKLMWIPQAFHSLEYPANEELALLLNKKSDKEKMKDKVKSHLSKKQEKLLAGLLETKGSKVLLGPINTPNEIREKILIERLNKYTQFIQNKGIPVVAVFPFLWSWGAGHPDVSGLHLMNVEVVSVRGLDLLPNLFQSYKDLAHSFALKKTEPVK